MKLIIVFGILCIIYQAHEISEHKMMEDRKILIERMIHDIRNEKYNSEKIISDYLIPIVGDKSEERKAYCRLVFSEMHVAINNVSQDKIAIYSFDEISIEEQRLFVLPPSLSKKDVYILKIEGVFYQSFSFAEDRIASLVTIKMGTQRRITPI